MMNQYYVPYLTANKKSKNTIKVYVDHINKFLNFVNKEDTEITYADIFTYQASISDKSANTVRQCIAAIKSYFKFLKKVKIIDEDPSIEIERPKANPKPKHYMTEEDIEGMIANARTDRDKAIVKFMVSTGVRISEMINITLDEYHEAINNGSHEITITGKGNKDRVIYLNDSTIEAIDIYLGTRCDDCPYLFASFRRNQINPESLSNTLKNMAKKAGIPFWKDISNHAMRAAFATIANEKGVDVPTISAAMGHSNVAITSLYIKNKQSNINHAMSAMSF